MKKQTAFRWLIFAAGLIILALGIILNTKTLLGVSPINSFPYVLSILTGINLGNMTMLLYFAFMALIFILRGKQYRLYDLLQLPVGFFFSRFLNIFSDAITYVPDTLWKQLLLLIPAVCLCGIGVAMSVNMDLVPDPANGLVAAISWKSGKNLGFCKNCFDASCVTAAFITGLLAHQILLGIGIGTVCAMIFTGRVVAVFDHFFREKLLRLAGMK